MRTAVVALALSRLAAEERPPRPRTQPLVPSADRPAAASRDRDPRTAVNAGREVNGHAA
jgi:hypothetical protein